MTKITWLGDHTDESGGPRVNVWNGVRFTIGEPVEVTDPYMIGKAKTHPQYKVEGKEKADVKEVQEEGQEGKSKEEKEGRYNYREAEKGSGYVPVKKKVRKKKALEAGPAPPVPDADT